MNNQVTVYLMKGTKAHSLACFRLLFGFAIFGTLIRFWLNGWIEKLYIEPSFHFTYFGFEWVQPLGSATYLLFLFCGLCALSFALGFYYRISALGLFLSFTYIELMDKTTYLNHYYFVSVVMLMMVFLPAQAVGSLDARRSPSKERGTIYKWQVDCLKFFVSIVYFYAGLAKLNSDWLLEAQPLATWLPGRSDLPLLGRYMEQSWMAYLFSWGGVLYDLIIPFFLWRKQTVYYAFIGVCVFHVLTLILFPIGVFPWVMIISAVLFFPSRIHEKSFIWFRSLFGDAGKKGCTRPTQASSWRTRSTGIALSVILLFQILFPFRFLCYPGNVFWHEQGFRFGWRVMVMEKAGYAQFTVKDPSSQKQWFVQNSDHLTAFQEKQMSFQPDFILEYAHYLKAFYSRSAGHDDLEVYVDAHVALNGRSSRLYVKPDVDLTKCRRGWRHKDWLLEFDNSIYEL